MTDARNATDQEIRARRIIDRLKMFNRKERDHFMKFALCEKPEAPVISTALWQMISNEEEKPTPDAMFVGMDYHLNWLYAAIATVGLEDRDLEAKQKSGFKNVWKCALPPDVSKKDRKPIQKNQEDVDLLVSWTTKDRLQVVLIEAKLDSGWGSDQIKSKRERLTLILEDAECRGVNFIDWRFLLMSPRTCPGRNEFGASLFDGRFKWMRDQNAPDAPGELWHAQMPVKATLRRVKRVTNEGVDWTTVPSLTADEDSNS